MRHNDPSKMVGLRCHRGFLLCGGLEVDVGCHHHAAAEGSFNNEGRGTFGHVSGGGRPDSHVTILIHISAITCDTPAIVCGTQGAKGLLYHNVEQCANRKVKKENR